MLALIGLLACTTENSPGLSLRSDPGVASWAIGRSEPKLLQLPLSVRPDGLPAPETMPILGPFTLVRTVSGVSTWEAELPARPRSLFFSRPPAGMQVESASGETWAHSSKNTAPHSTWAFTAQTVLVRTVDGPPDAGALVLRWPKAQQREDSLNLQTFATDPRDIFEQQAFLQRSVQVGEQTRTGLLMPAPSKVVWGGRALAKSAVLSFEGRVIPPEAMVTQRSDGAEVIVEVIADGAEPEQLYRGRVGTERWQQVKVDLAAYSGKIVDVVIRSVDSSDTTLDYVFLADPVIYTPLSDPKRMVLVFLDTTRPDHMGMYGYERNTTPELDAWAQDAAVFDQARSVAPWTLPSARSALTGRQPEHFEEGPHVAQVLADQGWATGAFVGNIYLSANFGMAQGWSEYAVENWPRVDAQVEKLDTFLARHEDRDALLMLHTMDMHLPYTEPLSYRRKWASSPPAGLTWSSTRSPILRAVRDNREAVQRWVQDRYDQNLRYTDTVLSELLERLGDQATVLLFSDHGEEFWDHQDFEHGHSLHEELLRVPFILKGPGVPAGRIEAPVSLLDLTPTVLDLLQVTPPSDMHMLGTSLLPATQGDAQALAALQERPQAFGRPLYGQERWGVLEDGQKWTTYKGTQTLVDLGQDPAESTDLSPESELSPYRDSMAQALQTTAPVSWRIDLSKAKGSSKHKQVLRISHPDGIQAAWIGQDPLKGSLMAMTGPTEQGAYEVLVLPGKRGGREIYLVPSDEQASLDGLKLEWLESSPDGERLVSSSVVSGSSVGTPDALGTRLSSGRIGPRSYSVTWGFAPVPTGKQIEGSNDELTEALQAMGYQERDED